MDKIAERIKLARMAKGLSQQELAERMGKNQSIVSRTELGTTNASTETLQKFCDALGMKHEEVFGEPPKIESKVAQALLEKESANEGLKMFILHASLRDSLNVTDDEWKLLGSINLPDTVSKDGYVNLLFTLRAIS